MDMEHKASCRPGVRDPDDDVEAYRKAEGSLGEEEAEAIGRTRTSYAEDPLLRVDPFRQAAYRTYVGLRSTEGAVTDLLLKVKLFSTLHTVDRLDEILEPLIGLFYGHLVQCSDFPHRRDDNLLLRRVRYLAHRRGISGGEYLHWERFHLAAIALATVTESYLSGKAYYGIVRHVLAYLPRAFVRLLEEELPGKTVRGRIDTVAYSGEVSVPASGREYVSMVSIPWLAGRTLTRRENLYRYLPRTSREDSGR